MIYIHGKKEDGDMIVIRLDRVLVNRKMTSRKLGEKINLCSGSLSKFKTGKMKNVNLRTLDKMCAALNCDVSDLLEYVRDEENEEEGIK